MTWSYRLLHRPSPLASLFLKQTASKAHPFTVYAAQGWVYVVPKQEENNVMLNITVLNDT